jgi:hypothetical protein
MVEMVEMVEREESPGEESDKVGGAPLRHSSDSELHHTDAELQFGSATPIVHYPFCKLSTKCNELRANGNSLINASIPRLYISMI